MNRTALFSIAALIPAAFGTGPAAGSITAQICTGSGALRVVTIPLGKSLPGRGGDDAPCCAKGCHAGGSRKRSARKI